MIAAVIMAIAGLAAGFAFDALIARLAGEAYEHEAFDDQPAEAAAGIPRTLGGEAGALRLPRSLTTGEDYRRMAVVAATALIFAAVGYQYRDHAWEMLIVAGYASALIVCTGTDLIAHRIPNIITFPAITGAFVAGMLAPEVNRADVLLGAAVGAGPLFAMFVMTRGAMGLGDVKLALFTGLALGLTLVIPAMLIMAISGGAVALLLLALRLRGRRDGIPYGPYIAAGALVVMLVQGTAILDL